MYIVQTNGQTVDHLMDCSSSAGWN